MDKAINALLVTYMVEAPLFSFFIAGLFLLAKLLWNI